MNNYKYFKLFNPKMSTLIGYRKEFEDIILKGKIEEALKTLVPNSTEKIYLQFCEEYKKCVTEKKITKELNQILENAKSRHLSTKLIQVLETRKDLLEYDLPSTSQEKKNKIIDGLYKNYCGENLNYEAPYFVREKKTSEEKLNKIKNNTPLILTEKMIEEARNKIARNTIYKIQNIPEKKRPKLFLQILEKDPNECMNIIYSRVKIPFYLMNKEEFSKIIKFFNDSKKNLMNFNFFLLTIEQIERILEEVDNPMYVDKKNLVSLLMNKKYNKLIKKANNKNDLNQVKEILNKVCKIFEKFNPELVPGILLQILKINKEQNILDIKPFIEYIKNPILDRLCYEQNNLYNNKITNECSISLIHIPSINFNDINKHKFIEELLIDFFIYDKAKPEDFNKYFKQEYLEKMEFIAKLYKGEEIKSDTYNKYLNDSEYEEIAQKAEITICEHNPKEFKVDEEVKIDLDLKNIKTINISIYEINTENYYLQKKAPLNSLINVEGIIASKTMDINIEGGDNPLKRIRKKIELDIPKGKPGVFLIELLGNGISTRIIIKKGRLNLITRNTSKGIKCQIINEKNEIVKGENTYILYNGHKFNSEPVEGLIILPYKVLTDSTNKCILVHNSYADITEIKRKTENYKLKGYFNFSNESIIPGNMLKISFKPLLFINGREASLELLKKGTIIVEMIKTENDEKLPVNTVFENISFKDDNKQYEFEVLVPPMMNHMNFRFNCEINNLNTSDKKSLSYEQNSLFFTSNNLISYPLLHKIGKNYFYENIGRNGENITNKAGTNATLKIIMNNSLDQVDVNLQYDQNGKLNLGELKNVMKIRIDETWYNLYEFSKYCYPERVDIIQGESFTLPLYSKNTISLDDDYFQLYEYYNNKEEPSVLKDIKNEIILKKLDINGDKDHYYEFTLGHNLTKGKYYLTFGQNEIDKTNIIIKVKEGNHWMNLENYIINDKGFIENSQIKTPIYMKNLTINKENGEIKFECAKTRRNIKYTHANIFLSQYQNPEINTYFNKYWNMLNDGLENLISSKFSKWKNIYLSNRVINEEIQYVLQRRNLSNHLGNSLPMPSLLLKRAYKTECENEEEKLEKGNEYKKMGADMCSGAGSGYGKGKALTYERSTNTDFYNFLKYSGYFLNNIEPININTNDESAKFEIKLNDKDILKKYSYIQIVLIDTKTISSSYHCLTEDNDKYEIEKRDISNEKALDNNKNISEIKKTELLKKGEKFNICETSNYKLLDSVQKLSNFYLLTLNQKEKYWDKFKFILNLNDEKFNEEDFLNKYNEVCGHEVNIFLYFKYPKLFNKYVKNIIKYKFEKTFIDYFLLDDYETLLQYLTPIKLKLLNTSELCLLLLKLVEKNPEEAEKIKNIIKSRVKKVEDVENLLLTNFNIMMNMRVEEDKDLDEIKQKVRIDSIRGVPSEECNLLDGGISFGSDFNNNIYGNGPREPMAPIFYGGRGGTGGTRGRGRFGGLGGGPRAFHPESNFLMSMKNAIERPMPVPMPIHPRPMTQAACISNIAMPQSMPMTQACFTSAMPFQTPPPPPPPVPAACYSNTIIPTTTTTSMNLKQDDYLNLEKSKEFKMAYQNALKDIGGEFEKPGVAKEYKERHYYIKEHKNNDIENPLWLDFAEHILKNKSHENFLSKYVLYNIINFNEFLLILSIIGLPIESEKHEYERITNSRLISITPGSNLILFTKELTEIQFLLNNKLLISQNVIDELHNDMNVNTDNCSIGITYSHQTIVTNISNQSLIFQLFIQIPRGSICLNNTYYTNSIKIKLNPYETKNYKTFFYFPKEGQYPQYHPVACKNNNIISVGNNLTYIVKKEYIPSKKNEIIENNKYGKNMRIEGKLRNILSDDSVDYKNKLNNIINYFNNDIFNDVDINNILYLLKNDKDFYNKLISILRKRGYYCSNVWSFGFHYKDEKAIKEYLTTKNNFKVDLGYQFKSSLYSYDDTDDAKMYPHLEYSPLYNARKHPFGNLNNKDETNIANKEFNEVYRKFIIDLLFVQKIQIKEKLRLIYYLILQDRMEEAMNLFSEINKEEIDDNQNKNYMIQYNYIYAYLDFCFGYPEFKIAKSICTKYKNFPLIHWRDKFEEIEDQLLEYEGKEKVSMDTISSENDEKSNKKALSKELREKEPKLSFSIDNKSGKLLILHSNISEIDLKLYFIDLETLFTRDPKISEIMNKDKNDDNNSNINMKEHFGFVRPNYSEVIKIPKEKINKNENGTSYDIPEQYRNKNLFVEIKAESLKLFDIYLSSNFNVIISENLGELKVCENNFKAIIKAYVKVYVELNNNQVQFYKDGYTDLNGKFNYLALNSDQLNNSKKFYIFVSEEKQGAIIKECYPPKNIERNNNNSGNDNLLEDVQRYRQIQRSKWRTINK